MKPQNANSECWEDCPDENLRTLATHARNRRMTRRAAWAIPLTLTMLFSLAWSGWLPAVFRFNSTYGQLTWPVVTHHLGQLSVAVR